MSTWRDDERVATARLAYAAMHWKYAMAEARRLLGATNVEECTALAAEAEAIGDAYAEAVASAVLAEQPCQHDHVSLLGSMEDCGVARCRRLCPPCAERAKRKEAR